MAISVIYLLHLPAQSIADHVYYHYFLELIKKSRNDSSEFIFISYLLSSSVAVVTQVQFYVTVNMTLFYVE
jgi:hypothetical protein